MHLHPMASSTCGGLTQAWRLPDDGNILLLMAIRPEGWSPQGTLPPVCLPWHEQAPSVIYKVASFCKKPSQCTLRGKWDIVLLFRGLITITIKLQLYRFWQFYLWTRYYKTAFGDYPCCVVKCRPICRPTGGIIRTIISPWARSFKETICCNSIYFVFTFSIYLIYFEWSALEWHSN